MKQTNCSRARLSQRRKTSRSDGRIEREIGCEPVELGHDPCHCARPDHLGGVCRPPECSRLQQREVHGRGSNECVHALRVIGPDDLVEIVEPDI